MRDNEVTAPRFLLKAGILAINLGKPDVARKHFNTITEKYPDTNEATKVNVYKGKVEAMQ
jgi:TolA-binding protein